jgi:hypothetical protein
MRILWADLAKARRDLIATRVLDDAPFLTRLWYRNLFWICSFIKTEGGRDIRQAPHPLYHRALLQVS